MTGMGSLDCLDASQADAVAYANHCTCAENFVKEHTGKAYKIDQQFGIEREIAAPQWP
jgi:hypothetical protein